MKVLFVTNFMPHYRKPLFELMARRWDVDFLFFSDGREWYWKSGTSSLGNLRAQQLPGFWMGGTRICPTLAWHVAGRRYDVVVKCINGKFALPVTFLLAKLRRKPFILWTGLWRHPTTKVQNRTARLVRRIYRGSSAIVTYGRHVARYVIGEGVDPDRVFVARQCVDLTLFTRKPTAAGGDPGSALEPPGPCTILYVGRLEPWKGPKILMEALHLLNFRSIDFRCLFVGDGSLRDELPTLADDAGLGTRVEFAGSLPNASLAGNYQAATVCVIPSIETSSFSEPWSLAANEAMAARALVVCSDVVGAAQDGLVEHEASGLVFPAGDAEALASHLFEALSKPEWRQRMVDEAARRVADYTFESAVQGFELAIEAATGRSPSNE